VAALSSSVCCQSQSCTLLNLFSGPFEVEQHTLSGGGCLLPGKGKIWGLIPPPARLPWCSLCAIAELTQNVSELEERCNKLSSDNSELEAAVDRLRTALAQMEQMKKDLQHKATSLTVLFLSLFCSILLYLSAKYLHAIGPNRVT